MSVVNWGVKTRVSLVLSVIEMHKHIFQNSLVGSDLNEKKAET